MLALGLSLALFVLWLVAGVAIMAALRAPGGALNRVLLAPAIGFASTLIVVFTVSRAGVPMRVGAAPILLALLIASGVLWVRARPTMSLRSYAPFAVVFVVGLIAIGWPMLEFGFDWISYSNDDMANYTLSAQRLVNHGFFEVPDADQLLRGRDYSLTYWFFNLGIRPGADMLVAWTSGLTGLSTHQAFMPLILAMHLTLISATGSLALRSERPYTAALIACGLIALSALTTLGALYQLIGQVGGLALLVACAAVLLHPYTGLDRGSQVRQGTLLAVVVAALFIMYPETVPFLGLSWIVYIVVALARHRERVATVVPVFAVALGVGVVFLNSYTINSLTFLLSQTSAGMAHAEIDTLLFPYYLVPSGLANLWGFQTVDRLLNEPWESASIVIGAALLLVTVVVAARGAWRLHPSAIVTVVMLVLGVELFVQRADFGLFKLAMFLQPFMLPTLVTAWVGFAGRRWAQVVPFVILGMAGIPGQIAYVERSQGLLEGVGGGLTEVPYASSGRVNDEFARLVAANPGAVNVVLDTPNVVLAKFQALYLIGRSSAFSTADFFYNIVNSDPGRQLFSPNVGVVAAQLQDARRERYVDRSFEMHDASEPALTNDFVIDDAGQPPRTDPQQTTLIASAYRQSIFNRRWNTNQTTDFLLQPWSQTKDHLAFISSRLGQPYYTGDRRHIAVYQLEPDWFYRGSSMSGLGRYMLFELVNPSPRIRLAIDMTASLAGDASNTLPQASIIGTDRQPMPFVGRGSARVFSPPVTPQFIDGRAFVGLDMGTDGTRFPSHRTGLNQLYGGDIPTDRRSLVGFARDISAMSDDAYVQMSPGATLTSFPDDLRNPHLEYSGIYEDGWMSETSFVKLAQPSGPTAFVFRGRIPGTAAQMDSNTVEVSIDDHQITKENLHAGDFELTVPVGAGEGLRKIQVRFSQTVNLSAPDYRPASAAIKSIGFEPWTGLMAASPQAATDIVSSDAGVQLEENWGPFESWQGQSFRWVDNDARLSIERPDCRLTLEVEAGPSIRNLPLALEAYGENGASLSSVRIAGRQTVTLGPVPGGTVRLHSQTSGEPIAGDGRVLNFRVFHALCTNDDNLTPATLLALNGQGDVTSENAYDQLARGQLPADALLLGSGWHSVESEVGQTFRWADTNAELVVTNAAADAHTVSLDIESGPGAGGQPLRVVVLDSESHPVGSFALTGRQTIQVTLPTHTGRTSVFRLRADNGGAVTPGDPRTLNFRVYSAR